MKSLTSTLSLLLMLFVTACAQNTYKLIAPVSNTPDGTIAYLVNFDTGEAIDSVAISHGAAVFTGDIDEPIAVRVVVNGSPVYTCILEQGSTAINEKLKRAAGSMLNDQFNEIVDGLNAIEQKAENITSEEEYNALLTEYVDYILPQIKENVDNPIGLFLISEVAPIMEVPAMLEFINQNPPLQEYQRVKKLVANGQVRLNTMEGKPFVDFEVEYDGQTYKLSDYVGKGQYTLVDFWASWCGPCIQEISVIKEIYNEYADKGLQVLGVAVWDEPENTLQAIKRLDIPWPVILNTQNVATDAYGIPAIPCIILFGPDGVIVSRDARGEQLKAIVAEAMQQ